MNKRNILVSVAALVAVCGLVTFIFFEGIDNKPSVSDSKSNQAVDRLGTELPNDKTVEDKTKLYVDESDSLESRGITIRAARIMPVIGHELESGDFLSAMRRRSVIEFSDEELDQLQRAYVNIVRKRTNYEASICEVETIDNYTHKLIIPKYQSKGVEFMREMYAEFEKIIGSSRAISIETHVGPALYIRNHGFGESRQEILVSLDKDTMYEPIYHFTHSSSRFQVDFYNESTSEINTVDIGEKTSKINLRISALGSYGSFAEMLPIGG